jgi:hypothetical protein
MTTTNNDRLDEILNDSPTNNGTKPKKKNRTVKECGQSAGQTQIGQLTTRNRQVADKITALNAKQTATFVIQDYVDGTFMEKTLDELDLLLEGFQNAFDEGLIVEAIEESDPLSLPSASGSSFAEEPEEAATCQAV